MSTAQHEVIGGPYLLDTCEELVAVARALTYVRSDVTPAGASQIARLEATTRELSVRARDANVTFDHTMGLLKACLSIGIGRSVRLEDVLSRPLEARLVGCVVETYFHTN